MSSDVVMDFTELRPPHGEQPRWVRQSPSKGQGVVAQKQEDLITIGFRVKPKEKAIIQDFVNRMYSQFVVDPDTNEPKRMLDYSIH